MIKFVSIVLLSALLVGCVTTSDPLLIQTKIEVVVPPETLYRCPGVNIPRGATLASLTEADVAKLLIALKGSNDTCRRSLQAIKNFLNDAANKVR